MAYFDQLTGLPDRAMVMAQLSQSMELAIAHGYVGGVLFVDLDGFKAVNDSVGHDAGDDVLRRTARRLEACVRGSDTVIRFGAGATGHNFPANEGAGAVPQTPEALNVGRVVRICRFTGPRSTEVR